MKSNLKTISFALVLAALPGRLTPAVHAAPVTFWFSGTVDYVSNPSNALPAGIAEGTPFSGRVTYDSALVYYTNWNSYAEGAILNTYFRQIAGFSMLVQIGGHTITNAMNADGYSNCGYLGVYDQYNNADELTLETAHADIIVDGQPTQISNTAPYLNLYLQDLTKTAFGSATWPTSPPTISQFPNLRVFSWLNRLDDVFNTTIYAVTGNISVLTTNELVALNLRPAASHAVQFGWPAAVSGYSLQFSTNLASATWQTVTNAVADLNMEHTVTVSAAGGTRFFRLKK